MSPTSAGKKIASATVIILSHDNVAQQNTRLPLLSTFYSFMHDDTCCQCAPSLSCLFQALSLAASQVAESRERRASLNTGYWRNRFHHSNICSRCTIDIDRSYRAVGEIICLLRVFRNVKCPSCTDEMCFP